MATPRTMTYNAQTKKWEPAKTLKKYNATTKRWEDIIPKIRQNGKWENALGDLDNYISQKEETKTYEAVWSETYTGDGNIKTGSGEPSGSLRFTQGRYGNHDTIGGIYYNPIYFGIQRGLIGFDASRIQQDLSGGTIKSIEVYLHAEHFWFVAGGNASIISHNFTGRPSKFNFVDSIKEEQYRGRGFGKWISLPISVGNDLKSGKITGLGVFKNSQDLKYYAHFTGASGPVSQRPKIRITYTKNYYTFPGGDTIVTDKPTVEPPKYTNYTVKANDTLWSISQKYNVTVGELQTWNSLTSSTITVGQVLKIYSNTQSVPASTPKYTSVIAGEGLTQVTERLMRQGLLSQDFFEARLTLMQLNGFTTSAPILQIGQQIMYSRGQ